MTKEANWTLIQTKEIDKSKNLKKVKSDHGKRLRENK